MTEATFRRDLIAELNGIRAALEAANAANPLAMIAEALGEGEPSQGGAEGAAGPTKALHGDGGVLIAEYRHPLAGWVIVARRDSNAPGGYALSAERER